MEGPHAEAAILAGGRARRLGGRQKALLEVDGEAILVRQLRALRPRVRRVGVVAEKLAPFREFDVEPIADRYPGAGPLAGIEAALAAARAPRVFVVACDMPDLSPGAIELLLARADAGADLVVPVAGGRPQPLCAVYAACAGPLVRERLSRGALRAVELPEAAERAGLRVDRVGERTLRAVDPELRTLSNLNTPVDWERRG